MQWAKERMRDGTRDARYKAREALGRDWKERWQSDFAAARRRRPPGAPTSPADHEPEFEEGKSLQRHKGLRKHESSVLIQDAYEEDRPPRIPAPAAGTGGANPGL